MERAGESLNQARTPRFEATGQLRVFEMGLGRGPSALLQLLNISAGGFLAVGRMPLPIGATRAFRFDAFDAQWGVNVSARVLRCVYRQTHPGGARQFQLAFAFVDGERPATRKKLGELVGRVDDRARHAESRRRPEPGPMDAIVRELAPNVYELLAGPVRLTTSSIPDALNEALRAMQGAGDIWICGADGRTRAILRTKLAAAGDAAAAG